MPIIIMTNNAELFHQLGASPFVRAAVDLVVVPSGAEMLDALERRPADLALVDLDLVDPDGLQVCAAIKQDPRRSHVRVGLVLHKVSDPGMLSRVAASGCDTVLSLPMDEDELYEIVAQILHLPRRKSPRVNVSIGLVLRAGNAEVPVEVQNISHGGMCVATKKLFDVGTSLAVCVDASRPGGPAELLARVAWTQPGADGQGRIGLEFQALRPELRALIGNLALWDLRTREDGVREASIHGELDEHTSWKGLAGLLAGSAPIAFDMSGVERMNSAGVRGWCNFITSVGESQELTFRRCSTAFTTQASMVPTVLGNGRIVSTRAPYVCSRCEREEEQLLDVAQIKIAGHLEEPRFPCSCGGEMILDDLAERYFAFVRGS
jgi:CheY-like chemotaxis protein/anti-anti-sigma regulatory factor